ncbi:MAG: DUF2127 domain-containing protein [Candidatus Saccharimonadales bacterium]
MKLSSRPFRESKWFEPVYKIGVAIKGFDGLVELVVGLMLWISPQLIHTILTNLAGELGERHAHVFQLIAEYIARVDVELAKSGAVFLILFLVTHGLVKLVLVYCLLKEIVRAYPVSLAILSAFLVYQLYVFIIHPTVGMAIFTILDAIIIWLVWGEYRELRDKKMVQ